MSAPLYIRRREFLDQYGVTNRLLASWQRRRLIPFVRVGRKVTLFRIEDIESFLRRHTVKSLARSAGGDGGTA